MTTDITIKRPHYVQFNGSRILTHTHGGEHYVAIKPICDTLGLDWDAQRQRINRDTALREGTVITTAPTRGGMQRTTLLRLDMLNGWLFGVSESRINPALRDKLVHYKRECYRALHQHFHSPALPAPSPDKLALASERYNHLSATTERAFGAIMQRAQIMQAWLEHMNPGIPEVTKQILREQLAGIQTAVLQRGC